MQRITQKSYCFGDFTLDLGRASLTRGAEEVRLRPRSFEALRYMVENPGRLLSKEELIQALWPDTFVTDDSLVKCLRDVRLALDDASNHYIKTVPRKGYLFDVDPGVGVRSLAVLPLKPLGVDEADRDLGLGVADTLITKLSGLGGIVVRPTSAVQKYVSPDQDTLAAGREQLVDAVLEGSIQRSQDRLRVTVRLLKVRDGSTLWADKYDQRITEIFAVQDAISGKVAEALALKLNGDERQRLAKRYTENIEAYQLYARGVFLRNQMTEEGLTRSTQCLQKAIELDPEYALAYAGLASSFSPQGWFGYIPVRVVQLRNRSLISKALELDDTLAEAHASLGELNLFFEWDWDGAERAFRRALELSPDEQLTHLLYPDLLLLRGRAREAISIIESAVKIDPVSPRVGKAAAEIYFLAGQYDRAIEQFDKVRELFPNYLMINAGPSYERKGMYDQAVQEYLDHEVRSGMPFADVTALRQAHAVRGWRGYWQKRLKLARTGESPKPSQSVFIAEIYARLGEKDQALDWLERACAERHPSLIFLNLDPKWESLRTHPRFRALLQQIRVSPAC